MACGAASGAIRKSVGIRGSFICYWVSLPRFFLPALSFFGSSDTDLPAVGLSSSSTDLEFGFCGIVVGGLLDERRVAHVEEFAALRQLEALVADIPLRAELDEDPLARRALLAAQLRGETAAVERHAFGQLRARQFGERGEEVAEVDEVLEHFAGGRGAFPVGDQRHAAAAFEHRAFLPLMRRPFEDATGRRRNGPCRCRR